MAERTITFYSEGGKNWKFEHHQSVSMIKNSSGKADTSCDISFQHISQLVWKSLIKGSNFFFENKQTLKNVLLDTCYGVVTKLIKFYDWKNDYLLLKKREKTSNFTKQYLRKKYKEIHRTCLWASRCKFEISHEIVLRLAWKVLAKDVKTT